MCNVLFSSKYFMISVHKVSDDGEGEGGGGDGVAQENCFQWQPKWYKRKFKYFKNHWEYMAN